MLRGSNENKGSHSGIRVPGALGISRSNSLRTSNGEPGATFWDKGPKTLRRFQQEFVGNEGAMRNSLGLEVRVPGRVLEICFGNKGPGTLRRFQLEFVGNEGAMRNSLWLEVRVPGMVLEISFRNKGPGP